MVWIYLAIAVSFLKACGELAGKIFTDVKKENSLDEYTLIFWARFFSAIILFPLIFFIEIPSSISWKFICILLISAVLNSIANISALKAVKHGELSIVWPLTALTLPFLLLSSYLINNETLNSYGYIWVIAIFMGTYFLWASELKKGFLKPIQAIYHDAGARYMFLTAVLWSITGPLDKLWVLETWVIWWMFFTNILISIFIFLYIFFIRKSFPFKTIIQSKHYKKIWAITLIGWLWVFLQMLAIKQTLVVYVIAIKRSSWIFSVLLGHIFFKEKNILWKLFAVSIMLVWVALISILWNI